MSRETVRTAVSRLSNLGLVTPFRGVGTIVRDTSPTPLAYVPTQPARTWAQQTGQPDDTDRVVQTGWQAADPAIADALQLTPGTRVLHRIRHASIGPRVAQIHEQWLPTTVSDAIHRATGTDLGSIATQPAGNVFQQMRDAGINPVEVTEIVTARMPHADETDILELAPGIPVIILHRVTRDPEGKPVETCVITAAADRRSWTYTVPL